TRALERASRQHGMRSHSPWTGSVCETTPRVCSSGAPEQPRRPHAASKGALVLAHSWCVVTQVDPMRPDLLDSPAGLRHDRVVECLEGILHAPAETLQVE